VQSVNHSEFAVFNYGYSAFFSTRNRNTDVETLVSVSVVKYRILVRFLWYIIP